MCRIRKEGKEDKERKIEAEETRRDKKVNLNIGKVQTDIREEKMKKKNNKLQKTT